MMPPRVENGWLLDRQGRKVMDLRPKRRIVSCPNRAVNPPNRRWKGRRNAT